MNKEDDKAVSHNDGVKSPSEGRSKGTNATSLTSNDGPHDQNKQRHSAPQSRDRSSTKDSTPSKDSLPTRDSPPTRDRKSIREEKLAAALRDNLRRRKTPAAKAPSSQEATVEDGQGQTTSSPPTTSKPDQS